MIGTKAQCITYLANIKSEAKKYEVKEHKEKRSLSQNAYYWTLVNKLAVITGEPSSKIHNLNLRSLGLREMIDGMIVRLVLPDSDATEAQVIESTTYHLKPTSETRTGHDGKSYRTYVMLRGSHTFNAEEMAALLNLVIQDAQHVGIETRTPEELARMKEYEKQAEQSNRHQLQDKAKRVGA